MLTVEGPRAVAEATPMGDAGDLRWVEPDEEGLERVRRGRTFFYRDENRRTVRDEATIARIRRLAIPPAWTAVWICTDERGHIQATGRDARGRKQYRYHAQWQALRGQNKFDHLIEVAAALPRIRSRVQATLASSDSTPTREHVLAALVRLLDTTWLRVGNDEYARTNATYGLSTLRDRHAAVRGATLKLSFVGKGGVRHEARVDDRRVARVVRRCQELPGQTLFQYVDEEGQLRRVGSTDVNAWLAEHGRSAITAKDFRTWHGSVQALELTLAACADGAEPVNAQHVLAQVARRLGNTVAVCRKAYVHPGVLALGERLVDDAVRASLRQQSWVTKPPARRGLGLHERQLLGLLRAARRGRAKTRRHPRNA